MTSLAPERTGLRAWLNSDTPRSRGHARAIALWGAVSDLARNPLTVFGALLILALLLTAAFAPLIATHAPDAQNLAGRLQPPGWNGHIFGTDELGRDIFSRIVYGSRVTLSVVAIVALTAPLFGLLIGTVAGTLGGWVDRVLMRFTDIVLAFPRLVLALAFVAARGPSIENAVIAIALTAWPPYARVARAEALTVRRSDYIAAARLGGASTPRIILFHVVPMCLSSVIVRVTLDMAGIILTAAGLGFLGLGAQPPLAEWGAMISSGRQFLLTNPWVATIPGIAILLVSLGFNLLGDGLRDVLDPRSAKR
ncbi:ABC transporter permease [Antarcticirhabdus aurantiaca]|uniref:ABC transporter permease n=1 Tax=Antarcticirhabdus aurantiaca TaxID=2606717 RepID=A0ACD4NSD8_9HYPH|nr:ABC transporter permease [Antarcticirhabdus aurantiaca]WAJ29717.1 ABC transporter permease [Jeongeuplla avenae]